MPRKPAMPPEAARRAPITVGEGLDFGLTRHELDGGRWHRFGRGVRAWGALDPTDPKVRIQAALLQMPEGVVLGGWAALWWQGVHELDGRTGRGGKTLQPILVHIGPSGRMRPHPRIVVDRSRFDESDVIECHGVRVMSGTRAVFDVMCLDGAEEGVVAGDAAWKAGSTSRQRLADYVDAHAGARGVPAARLAVPLLDRRVKSRPESRMRYVWVVEAGLPIPLVNRCIVDGNGFVIAEADLLDLEAALVGEYEGEDHRTIARHTADNVREEDIEGLNLLVVRATAIDLWPQRPRLVTRLQLAHERGLARDRSRDAWGVRTS